MFELFKIFPEFKFDSFTLRAINPNHDAQSYFNYTTDARVSRFLAEDDKPLSVEHANMELKYWADLFRMQRSIYWAIADNETNRLIGTCGFNSWSFTHARGEISYDLDPEFWGRGIMTQVLEKVIIFGFEKMQLIRIQATVSEDNYPSINLLKRLKFEKEGLMQKYGRLEGKAHNFYLYALLS